MSAPIVLWHGAQRWEGPPEIRQQRKGHVAHGPGIYLTTSVSTARKYAKGGGTLIRFEIDPHLRWLRQSSFILLDDIRRWLDDQPRMRKKREIYQRLVYLASLTPTPDRVPAEFLINLMVNEDVAHGPAGAALAKFLTGHGVDASHALSKDGEDWVVLFNPRVVLRWERVSAGAAVDAPRIIKALEALL